MKHVELYTDGACSGNPGPGGWGAILIYKETEKELSGGAPDTTNNRMELTGIIEGLKALKNPCDVTVYSDSKYVVDAIVKGWAKSWKAKNWVKSDRQPAKNPDLLDCLREKLLQPRIIVLRAIDKLGDLQETLTRNAGAGHICGAMSVILSELIVKGDL